MNLKIFTMVFVTVFLAELGDKTQLATLSFSSSSRQFSTVFLASAAALVVSSLVATLAGKWLGQVLPMRWLFLINSTIFLLIGLSMFAHAWHLFAGGTEPSPVETPLRNTAFRLRLAVPMSGPFHRSGQSFLQGALVAMDEHQRSGPAASPCVALEVIDFTAPVSERSLPDLRLYDTGFLLRSRLTSLVRTHQTPGGMLVDLRLLAPFVVTAGNAADAGAVVAGQACPVASGPGPQVGDPATAAPALAWLHPACFERELAAAELASDDPRTASFAAAYQSRFNQAPDFMAAHGYDVGGFLMGLLASQPAQRIELLGHLQKMDLQGLSGRYTYRADMPFDSEALVGEP